MECIHCGARLRASARFCNVCGRPQTPPSGAPDIADEVTDRAPVVGLVGQVGQGRPEDGPASSGGGRVARPPRVPRAPSPDDASGPRPPADADDWERIETMEHDTLASRPRGPMTQPLATREINEQEGTPADGLPWPLPPSMIVGGRYRVVALLSAGPAEPEAENVYAVRDLQGYERCWSCQTIYGAAAATERYCRKCGADMLAHEYTLHERLCAVDEVAAASGGAIPIDAISTGAPLLAGERSFAQGRRAYRVVPRAEESSPFPRGAHIQAAAATDPGQGKPDGHNEDSQGLLLLQLSSDAGSSPLALGVVADGLGGHASGREASQLVVRVLSDAMLRSVVAPLSASANFTLPTGMSFEHALRAGIAAADSALRGGNVAQRLDMGSTLVAALVAGDTAYIANAGDSRAYVLDEQGLRRITTDHSLVEQLVAGGLITPDERYSHPQRNQIYRSLGGERPVEVDVFVQKLRSGMRLLLCSDGLWEMVRDEDIALILRETSNLQEACDSLVRAANAGGGEDNISALVIEANA